jgi:MerR family transcriptional regulator, heat shock protein HspR
MTQPLDDENAPLYTVGQVAQLLAVKQAFLRRCDELRVVSPQRSAGGQRRYTRVEIQVIQQVVSMTDEGMTLPAIRRIIDLEERLAVVTMQRDELARRLAELTMRQHDRDQGYAQNPSRAQNPNHAQNQDQNLARFRAAGLGELLEHRQRGREGGPLRRGQRAEALREHQR